MARKVATIKQTSGEGFSFEEEVGAYYAVNMLAATEPFGAGKGTIVKICRQQRAKGFYLDDIVLTIHSEASKSQIALSVKSNAQFSRVSAPRDFVEDIWEQFLCSDSPSFDRDSDHMGLITSPQPSPQKTNIQTLLRLAKSQEPHDLQSNIGVEGYVSRETKLLFSSFECPENLTRDSGHSLGPADILRRIYVLEFDFGNDVSDKQKEAISICRSLLTSGDLAEARKLWESVLRIIRENSGGCLDRAGLVDKLRATYSLKDFPDYESDWENLRSWSSQNMRAIKTTIGGSLLLQKDKQKDDLSAIFEKANVVALLGDSGTGKTVLAKLYVQHLLENGTVIWMNSDELKNGRIFTGKRIPGLRHSLCEVLLNLASSSGLLVLDRAERLRGEDDFQQLARLFNAILPAHPWKVLITCRAEHWERIQREFLGLASTDAIETYTIGYLEKGELDLVYKSFPKIQSLSSRAQLGQLIEVPEIIDLLVRGMQSKKLSEDVNWIGETDIINWLWESIKSSCDEGYALLSFVQRMAELQADEGEFTTPITQFKPDEASYLRILDDEGICTEDRGRISFQHDLYADWARCQSIIDHESNIENYLRVRALNPFWHKAIRLYGLYLIEQKSDVDSWCNAIGQYDFIKDCLLDSIIFAANSRELLEKVYQLLIANNGELLTRLLKRFLIIATCPNPSHIRFASTVGKDYASIARTLDRIPLWIYWPTALMFLSKHRGDLVGMVPSEIAVITRTWLRWTPLDYPLRREAAELALAVGNATYERRKAHPYSSRDQQDKLRYGAALSAALEFPDDVIELALKASGRIVPEDVASGEVGDYKKPGSKTTVHGPGFSLPAEVPEPWPDGPKNRVDDAFQDICLSSESLLLLMVKRPQAVEEIVLSLIIDLKRPKSGYDDYHWMDNDIELQHLRQIFWPRGWHKGPFLNFLRCSEEYGLDTIIRLVDFATEKLLEARRTDNNKPIELNIEGKTKHFSGGARIYNWHRGDAFCSDVIASALMALEKYLYECIEKKQDVSPTLRKILAQSKSVAFWGLACEVGRYRPELFIDALRPLLFTPEFYSWEDYCRMQNLGNAISFSMEPIEIRKTMLEWENMPHRKIRLMDVAVHLFLKVESLETFFASFKRSLEQRLEANPDEGDITETIKALIPVFDRKNWKEAKTPDNKNALQYVPPDSFRKEAEAKLAEIGKRQNILCFPFYCRRVLDKEITLKNDDIEPFWKQVKQLSEDTFDDDDDTLKRVADGIAGGIAVLVKCHNEWLKAHSEYMTWCVEWIVDLMKNQPPREEFNYSSSVGSLYWDSFISEIAPILWSEDPDSKQWREVIAELICLRHYDSMNLLMKSAYQLRYKLGKAFYELVNLVVLHATVGNRLQFQFRPRTKEVTKQYRKIIKRLSSYKRKFVKSSLGCNISSWAAAPVNGAELLPYRPRRRGFRISGSGLDDELAAYDTVTIYRKRPEVDLQLIGSSFKDIFSIEDAKYVVEQEDWLQFWEQALICRLAFNQCFDKDGVVITVEEHESDPTWMSDSNLLQPIAKFIVGMNDTRRTEKLWKPIMNLGPSDHYFIESFLSWFFHFGFERDHNETFMAVWKLLLNDFSNSNRWYLNRSSRQWHEIYEVWASLLGIYPRVNFSYADRHQNAINAMKDYYFQWAKNRLSSDAYSTMYFSELLKKPVAHLIRLDAIAWIKDAANKGSEWWWKEEGLVGSLAELLSITWEHHKAEYAKNREAHSSFRELLQLLVSKQHPVAIDLQARLGEEKL